MNLKSIRWLTAATVTLIFLQAPCLFAQEPLAQESPQSFGTPSDAPMPSAPPSVNVVPEKQREEPSAIPSPVSTGTHGME